MFNSSDNRQAGSREDYEVPNTPTEPISQIAWSPSADLLGAACWDKCAYVWNVQKQIQNDKGQFKAEPIGKTQHAAPVLSVAFSRDNIMFSGSCDGVIRMLKIQGGQQGDLGKHEGGVKALEWCDALGLLISASWDKTIKFWKVSEGKCVYSIPMPERVYACRVKDNLMVAACADKKLYFFDVTKPEKPWKIMDTPLKYQTKSLAIFPDKKGFAVGSIEGRVQLHFFDDPQRTFTFKCHRVQMGSNPNSSEVYAVNALDFHPKGCFSTIGSDGSYHYWCKESKTRTLKNNTMKLPISDGKFSTNGDIFAYTQCYDWSKGYENYQSGQKSYIYLHYPKAIEITPKERSIK